MHAEPVTGAEAPTPIHLVCPNRCPCACGGDHPVNGIAIPGVTCAKCGGVMVPMDGGSFEGAK